MALLGKPTGPVVEMTTDAHASTNQKTMLDFFSPPSRRGRRAKAAETRGRKAAVSQSLPARKPPRHGKGPAVPQPMPQAAAAPKQTRTNWSKGENLKKLTQAVAEWTDGSGRAAPREFLGEPELRKPSLAEFAALVDIPKGTIGNYVTSTEGKARSLGASSGRSSHLSSDDKLFVADNLRRADRGNDGMSNQKAIDVVQDLKPALSRSQAETALRAVRREHSSVLTGIAKTQATTTKRSAVTVTQQFRWHTLYDSVLEELRTHNTGRCELTGKTFGRGSRSIYLGRR